MLLAAGCGGGEAGDRAAAPCVPAATVAADVGEALDGTAIAIAARDDRFDPACVEVEGGGAVTIVVRNEGGHPHNLTLPGGDAVAVDAGQVAILETTITGDSMRYTCTIHPGMDGEIRRRRT